MIVSARNTLHLAEQTEENGWLCIRRLGRITRSLSPVNRKSIFEAKLPYLSAEIRVGIAV